MKPVYFHSLLYKRSHNQKYLIFPSISPKHAIVRMEGDGEKFTLEPGEPNVRLMHNGNAVVDKVELNHNDR